MDGKLKWDCRYYESGSCLVVPVNASRPLPHFYVYGPRMETERDTTIRRKRTCEQVCHFLNGGAPPLWASHVQYDLTSCYNETGLHITATGPTEVILPTHRVPPQTVLDRIMIMQWLRRAARQLSLSPPILR